MGIKWELDNWLALCPEIGWEKILQNGRELNPCFQAEKIIADMPNKPAITHNEARAYYRPSADLVNMPKKELFLSDAEYYSTLFHELAHYVDFPIMPR